MFETKRACFFFRVQIDISRHYSLVLLVRLAYTLVHALLFFYVNTMDAGLSAEIMLMWKGNTLGLAKDAGTAIGDPRRHGHKIQAVYAVRRNEKGTRFKSYAYKTIYKVYLQT